MRAQKERDPHRFYDVLKVLGDGSMGRVSKVQKRKSAIGGSARTDFVEKERLSKRLSERCFGFPCFFCPIFAEEKCEDILTTIDERNEELNEEKSESPESEHSLSSRGKKVKEFQTHKSASASSIITFDEKKNVTLALKSIHLDRVKDLIFRQELMNEIAILQKLDHPHIVKAIETFDYRNRLYLVLELCSGGDLYSR
jgi:serine/threonine protein kinase